MPKPKIDLYMSKFPPLKFYTCRSCNAETRIVPSGPFKSFVRYGCEHMYLAVTVILLDRDLKTPATNLLYRKMGKNPKALAEALFPAPKKKLA